MADRGDDRLAELLREAKRLGATSARKIPATKIVLDERVRLKCIAPRCENYAQHLLCPPNLMSVEDFRKIVTLYKRAIVVQVESEANSLDRSMSGLDKNLTKKLGNGQAGVQDQKKLHAIVNGVERLAFKRGFYLAAGLIGSDCSLCVKCVGAKGAPCRHPYEARPSMQGMGIDVLRTCRNVGLTIKFSSEGKVKWTGLVLLD